MVGQRWVLQPFPCIIRLLDNRAVRPCINKQTQIGCTLRPCTQWQPGTDCCSCLDSTALSPRHTGQSNRGHGNCGLSTSKRVSSTILHQLTEYDVRNEPGRPYVGHQPAHPAVPCCPGALRYVRCLGYVAVGDHATLAIPIMIFCMQTGPGGFARLAPGAACAGNAEKCSQCTQTYVAVGQSTMAVSGPR